MITRPLDLASKLRPEPQNFDYLFLVNTGLIVLFFFLFGSPFVLAPGLGLDFQLPLVAGARANAVRTTHHITVTQSGSIITAEGAADLRRLGDWLTAEKLGTPQPSLLITADVRVPMGRLAEISSVARAAGFTVQCAVGEPTARETTTGH